MIKDQSIDYPLKSITQRRTKRIIRLSRPFSKMMFAFLFRLIYCTAQVSTVLIFDSVMDAQGFCHLYFHGSKQLCILYL